MAKRGLRVPAFLRDAGFTAGNNGSVEQRIQVPNGYLDIVFSEGGFKKIDTKERLVKAVAFLAFQGGQKSRQAEIEKILGSVDDLKRINQTLDRAVNAVVDSRL